MEDAVSRSDEAGAVAERNEEAFRRLIEDGFGRGDLAVVDEVIAPGCQEHQPGIGPGPEGVKGTIRFLRSVYPDLTLTIEDTAVAGDKVWGRIRARGTHLGPLMGQPPTGRRIEIDVIDVCRFEDGQIVEHWGVPDRFAQLEQLGLLPRPQPQPADARQ
jgi:predicted SnoaL-like aldol condensation-catalyzing enzyme